MHVFIIIFLTLQKTAQYPNFTPVTSTNKKSSIKYTATVESICPLFYQRIQLQVLRNTTADDSLVTEVEATTAILDNIIIKSCVWVSNCTTRKIPNITGSIYIYNHVILQMKSISGHTEQYNCTSINSAVVSIRPLCLLIEVHKTARKLFTTFKRHLYNGKGSLIYTDRNQRQWIKDTFSGHIPADDALLTINTADRYNCQQKLNSVVC